MKQTAALLRTKALSRPYPLVLAQGFLISVMSANIGLDDPDLTAIVTNLNELAFAALFVRHTPVMSVIG